MMIGVLVAFRFDDGFDAVKLRTIAEGARGKFEYMPGLRSKTFTLSTERREAINFYIWDSVEAAEQFFTEDTVGYISGLYGVRPTITFLDVLARVENDPYS